MNAPAGPRLSVLLITLNEERLLDEVLSSVAWADEIVVVDSGSTDRTEEIARRFTDHFHVHQYRGEGTQRLQSLELATGDWVLYVDGDEVVTPRLASSIREAIADPRHHAGYRIQLHTFLLGTWFGPRGWRKEWKVRLFARDRGTFDPAPVHSGSVVSGPIGTLDGALHHFPYRDLTHQLTKLNRYSSVLGEAIARRRGAVSIFTALAHGLLRFLRDYLLGGDFLYGGAGFVRSATMAYFTFLKYAKAWEIGRTASAPSGREASGPTQ